MCVKTDKCDTFNHSCTVGFESWDQLQRLKPLFDRRGRGDLNGGFKLETRLNQAG